MNTIVVSRKNYAIVDTKEKITVADSFVVRSNKIGGGNGEAKFYIGNDNVELRNFFGDHGFILKCIIRKNDLIQYLLDCKSEYEKPEQEYRDKENMPNLWQIRYNNIKDLDEVIYFDLIEQTQIEGPRIYVKSDSKYYKLIRELSLPNITYVSLIKLKRNNEYFYYLRLFVDYFNDVQHPNEIEKEVEEIENKNISSEEKKQLIRAREGQGKYRKALLDECPFCPITLVSDDRLLIASHIKPWVKSEEHEKIDPKNGFMFTPTFDFLFDRGFISFTNDKKMLISPWLSKMTCSKLNISPDKKYAMLPIEGRENYLEYHRSFIYKTAG